MPIQENIKIYIDVTEDQINTELTDTLMDLHEPIVANRFKILEDYYKGNHEILSRVIEEDKPNNKPITNFCSYITDTLTGFFVGKPVSYTSTDKEYLNILTDIFEDSDEQAENHDLAHKASIKGQSYELVYQDEEGNTCFQSLDTDGVIMVYDTSIKSKPSMAMRYFKVYNYITLDYYIKIDVYTKTNIYHYTQEGATTELDSQEPHYFGEVPIVEFENNRYCRGDFENIITLNNMYNKNTADISNDIEYFSNCYLGITGAEGTTADDIKVIKENRTIILPVGGSAGFITKQINDSCVQNHRDNLAEDIHKTAYVPDLSKEINSNVSGSALKTKMFTTADIIVNKERKFKKALQTRIRLITKMLNLKGYKKDGANIKTHDYNYKDIAINFHRNMPVGLFETADDIAKMSTVVTKKTLLTEIGIEDVQAELDGLDGESNSMVDLNSLHNDVTPTDATPTIDTTVKPVDTTVKTNGQ